MERDWLLSEIATGLQKLLVLSLERSPASELIAGTACAWHEALTVGTTWDEKRDAERIRTAFRTLAATRTHWPAPRHLLEVLPRISGQRALAKPAPDPKVAEAHLAKIREALRLSPSEAAHLGPEGMIRAGEGLLEAEEELRKHYRNVPRSGKDAAAEQGA